jgi:hypothetical protein
MRRATLAIATRLLPAPCAYADDVADLAQQPANPIASTALAHDLDGAALHLEGVAFPWRS